jgi:hypothetical protein
VWRLVIENELVPQHFEESTTAISVFDEADAAAAGTDLSSRRSANVLGFSQPVPQAPRLAVGVK